MVAFIFTLPKYGFFNGTNSNPVTRGIIEKFQPNVALFSHIHEASGMEDKIGKSRLVNVSRRGFIIDV